MTDMQERIRRLEDRAERLGLVVRYFVASDDDDRQALGARFAIDGRFGEGGFPPGVPSRVEGGQVRARRAAARFPSVPSVTLWSTLGETGSGRSSNGR
jgi:hypothetical protein